MVCVFFPLSYLFRKICKVPSTIRKHRKRFGDLIASIPVAKKTQAVRNAFATWIVHVVYIDNFGFYLQKKNSVNTRLGFRLYNGPELETDANQLFSNASDGM